MDTLKFKTDIKCGGCLEKVSLHLDANDGIRNWEVDLKDPNEILTASVHKVSKEELISASKRPALKLNPSYR